MTGESASATASITDRHTGGWGYAAALTPIIFGTTYVLTTEFLPPDRPLLAALMRSLPTGLVLIIGSPIPPRRWMARFFVLSVLYASGLFSATLHRRLPAARWRSGCDQLAEPVACRGDLCAVAG